MGETSTLIAMRDKIDERLRHSEAVARSAPMAFMNQLQLWNILQMMNAGQLNTLDYYLL
jgi:phage shock protein A